MRSNCGLPLVAAAAGWNVFVNRFLPERRYVAANLAATAAAIAGSTLAGAGPSKIGLAPQALRSGLRYGLGGAAIVGTATMAASRAPMSRDLFADARAQPHDVAYQVFVRIPLGTVVLEEVLFRGMLPAAIRGARADLAASALFGLWHIVPTQNTLDINQLTDPTLRLRAVAAGVGATFIAGLGLAAIRRRSGSLLAPMLIHWSANAVAYTIAARRDR